MKQKYIIMKNDEKDELIIRELGELDKDMYSLLCEEVYDSKYIRTAISEGKTTLISAIRTENLFPIGIYAEKIADAITQMYDFENDQSVELFFNDIDLVAREQVSTLVVDDGDGKPSDIDELLDDDTDVPDFEEKDDIGNITYPLKITDDDSEAIDDDND